MRENWSSRYGFLFVTMGASIGIGNLWHFPFYAYKNGGGAFLIPYFVALATCAIPMMMIECAYGRAIRGGSVKAFTKLNKRLEIVGWIQIMIPAIVMMFYSSIISVSLLYMVGCISYMFGNTSLLDLTNPAIFIGKIAGDVENAFDFKYGISNYMIISVIIIWILNFVIVKRGIVKGIEKVSKIITPLLIALILFFLYKCLSLDGANDGIRALFKPDFFKILDPTVWILAYSQVFFSTSIAVGAMIAYGSYLSEEDDIVNNSFITVLTNASFDIISGIVVFSILGFLVKKTGVDIDGFGNSAGIAFIAFPIAISQMSESIITQGLIGFMFFFALFIAGMSSSISMVEAINTAVLDKYDIDRKTITIIVCVFGVLGGIGFSSYVGFNAILDIVNRYIVDYIIATVGIIEVIAITYIYSIDKVSYEVNKSSDFKVSKDYLRVLKIVTPLILGISVIINIIDGVGNLIHLNGILFWEDLIFGVGTIVIMILISYFLYKMPWSKDLN